MHTPERFACCTHCDRSASPWPAATLSTRTKIERSILLRRCCFGRRRHAERVVAVPFKHVPACVGRVRDTALTSLLGKIPAPTNLCLSAACDHETSRSYPQYQTVRSQ